ncbi:MAG: S41 family peptidase [Planctomycetota bacterium]
MRKQDQHSRLAALAIALFALATTTALADAPKVVGVFPENGDTNVDPTTSELRVVFDRKMDTGGFSICGGGPKFPEVVKPPKWVNKTTLVMKVRLKPGHDYVLSLNCQGATNFRSVDGTPLEPVPWKFSTSGEPESAHTPQIVEMVPENDATDVDPGVKEMRVVFDRPMQTGGFSLCGGGPNFPNIIGKPKWINDTTLVAKVKLKPDHDYRLSVNCPAAQNFRGADGTPVEPVPWSFSTAATTQKLSKAEQKKLNKRCLKQLMKALRDHYSYRELRGINWDSLEKKHGKKIASAKSTRSWVKRVAKMLSAAQDMHMWLVYRDDTTGTFRRNITANFTMDGIKAVLPGLTKRNDSVHTARTDDDVGYIMVTNLSHQNAGELEVVQGVLAEYRDCKALILDLRPNGGGAEPLAMPIAAWFVRGEKVYAEHVYRDPDAKTGFSKVSKRTLTGNTEKSKQFDKPVAVLIGPGIMSSCEAFVLMMKQGENVTLVGERTFGSSGNPKSHKLDNGVEVFIPSWKAMLPDGTCFEGKGIKPDILVKAKSSEFQRDDPVIRRALKLLRKKAE